MSSTVTTALVIGGGIAGPVTAMAFQRAGIEATVYEAYQGTADGVGGAMGIAANGQNALRAIGLEHLVRDIGIPTKSMVLRSGTGKRLATFETPANQQVTQTVVRADLYRAIYNEATARGVRVEHGKRLVRVAQDTDGVTAYFADGSTARGDILVGADGIRSTVRSLIDPNAPDPSYTGLYSAGGWAHHTGLPSSNGEMHLVFGKHAFFGYQILDNGTAGWWINIPSEQHLTVAQMKQTPNAEWLRRFRELVAEDNTRASAILAAVNPEDLVLTAASEYLPNVPTWHAGRIVLVGDSAHAPSSSSGQGASLAIEDAVQLARCLRDLPTPAEAFAAYEELRRPRVQRVIADTEKTNSNKTAKGFGRVMRDLLMPVLMKLFVKPEKMAWLVGYQIDWDAPVAKVPVAA